MKEELTVYVEPESMGEESSQTEMKLFATLQGYTSTPEQIDKPADPKLVKEIQRAKEVANEVPAAAPVSTTAAPVSVATTAPSSICQPIVRESKYGFTITDFILLLIAGLLFLNIITK